MLKLVFLDFLINRFLMKKDPGCIRLGDDFRRNLLMVLTMLTFPCYQVEDNKQNLLEHSNFAFCAAHFLSQFSFIYFSDLRVTFIWFFVSRFIKTIFIGYIIHLNSLKVKPDISEFPKICSNIA